jgi:hypothetical protein
MEAFPKERAPTNSYLTFSIKKPNTTKNGLRMVRSKKMEKQDQTRQTFTHVLKVKRLPNAYSVFFSSEAQAVLSKLKIQEYKIQQPSLICLFHYYRYPGRAPDWLNLVTLRHYLPLLLINLTL